MWHTELNRLITLFLFILCSQQNVWLRKRNDYFSFSLNKICTHQNVWLRTRYVYENSHWYIKALQQNTANVPQQSILGIKEFSMIQFNDRDHKIPNQTKLNQSKPNQTRFPLNVKFSAISYQMFIKIGMVICVTLRHINMQKNLMIRVCMCA